MAIKLVVFDLDGTLLDTLSDIQGAINYALSAWDIPAVKREVMREYIGHGLRNALFAALEHSGKSVDEEDFPLMVELMMNSYRRHPSDHTTPYDGVVDMLKILSSKNIMIGVLSNKSDELVKRIVSDILPEVNFSFVLGQSERFPLKPNPTSLEAMMKKFGVNRDECLYVGDSEVDYQTASNANVDGIIVNYGFRTKDELEKSGIYNTVSSPEELLQKMLLKIK